MDPFPNECIYSILLFLNPKYLQCTLLTECFAALSKLKFAKYKYFRNGHLKFKTLLSFANFSLLRDSETLC